MTDRAMVPPDVLAAMDQAHAEASQVLDVMIASFKYGREPERALEPRELDVSAFASAVRDEMERDASVLAGLLAIAIDRLAGKP